MRLLYLIRIVLLFVFVVLSGCGQLQISENTNKRIKIGILLADYGLGDQSFNDTAFLGLIKAREELNIIFDYRDLRSSHSYQQGFMELIEEEKCDLIIGLGYNMIKEATDVAQKHPNQQFLFIDQKIDLPNVTSVTFKEDEGSFLVGLIAGLKTKTNSVGFIGGMDIPVIHRFRDGFVSGVKVANPQANIIVEYADDFGKPEIGREIARKMIVSNDVDIIFPAAGFTGLGSLEEAVDQGKYAIGVDSDQFYVAEKAVITSMLKNIDVAVYSAVKQFVENGSLSERHIELGIKENGVGMAPIRITSLSSEETQLVESLTKQFVEGSISIKP